VACPILKYSGDFPDRFSSKYFSVEMVLTIVPKTSSFTCKLQGQVSQMPCQSATVTPSLSRITQFFQNYDRFHRC
jgi:hypothetical protein